MSSLFKDKNENFNEVQENTEKKIENFIIENLIKISKNG